MDKKKHRVVLYVDDKGQYNQFRAELLKDNKSVSVWLREQIEKYLNKKK